MLAHKSLELQSFIKYRQRKMMMLKPKEVVYHYLFQRGTQVSITASLESEGHCLFLNAERIMWS